MSPADTDATQVQPHPLPALEDPSPVVSVCCITYNHERFIGRALESFLAQQTSFPVEIIVHDDASSDGTPEIVRDHCTRHPGRIRAVLRTENQHRQGRGIIPMFAGWAKGEFIALCEGDDFWTAPDKLQTQVEYMRANQDCVACCHDSSVVDETGDTVKESYFRPIEQKFTQADVIGTLLSREPTCSLLFRRSAFLPPLPSWYLRRPSDLYLDILITEHGRLGFIDRNMAAYRVHAGGVWSGEREAARLVELIVRYRFLLSEANFRGRYRELLQRKIAEFEAQLFTRADSHTEIARLESIVQEQSAAVSSTQRENQRLAQREQELQTELEQARTQTQQHIDDLRVQLAQLAATAQQQADHLAVLEKERDRLTALAAQHSRDIAHLASTAKVQAEHIAVLEKERDRLAALVTQYSGDIAHLSSTAKIQTDHIAVLEKERDRLAARETQLTGETAHYRKVMDEQLRYIKILEAERSQAPSPES